MFFQYFSVLNEIVTNREMLKFRHIRNIRYFSSDVQFSVFNKEWKRQ